MHLVAVLSCVSATRLLAAGRGLAALSGDLAASRIFDMACHTHPTRALGQPDASCGALRFDSETQKIPDTVHDPTMGSPHPQMSTVPCRLDVCVVGRLGPHANVLSFRSPYWQHGAGRVLPVVAWHNLLRLWGLASGCGAASH